MPRRTHGPALRDLRGVARPDRLAAQAQQLDALARRGRLAGRPSPPGAAPAVERTASGLLVARFRPDAALDWPT